MEAAVERGLRPTTLTHRRRHPHGRWSDLDFVLLEAYQSMKAERSSSTGLPIWLTRSADPNVYFDIREGIDGADAAIAEHDKAARGKKGDKEIPPGTYRYPVPQMLDGSAVPDGGLARERMLEKLREAQAGSNPLNPNLGIQTKRPAGGYNLEEYG